MKKRILVIEDNPWNARLIHEILGDAEYQIIEAADGEAGIDLAKANPPDMILLDLMLPKLSGEDVIRKLRGLPDLTETPIIVVTANANHAMRELVMKAGATDYINKPFTKRVLQDVVKRHLPDTSIS